jgi:hypothetical protein
MVEITGLARVQHSLGASTAAGGSNGQHGAAVVVTSLSGQKRTSTKSFASRTIQDPFKLDWMERSCSTVMSACKLLAGDGGPFLRAVRTPSEADSINNLG